MDTHLISQLYLSPIFRIDHLGDMPKDRPILPSYHFEGLLCADTVINTLYFQLGIIIIGTIDRHDYTHFTD